MGLLIGKGIDMDDFDELVRAGDRAYWDQRYKEFSDECDKHADPEKDGYALEYMIFNSPEFTTIYEYEEHTTILDAVVAMTGQYPYYTIDSHFSSLKRFLQISPFDDISNENLLKCFRYISHFYPEADKYIIAMENGFYKEALENFVSDYS